MLHSTDESDRSFSFQSLIPCHLTPFDWKFLQIGTLRAKDLRKNLSKLQNGELTPVPLTLLVIRVVLLLWSYGSYKGFWAQLYACISFNRGMILYLWNFCRYKFYCLEVSMHHLLQLKRLDCDAKVFFYKIFIKFATRWVFLCFKIILNIA